MADKYVLSVYIAAPGTPLKEGGTSLPGHMYYGLQHGNEVLSFGLAPKQHGEMNGPGKVYTDDVSNYQNPRYTRTFEVTKEQYEKLKAFGENPAVAGFDTYYKDVRNNCVDFTWAALNHAGLHKTDPKIIGYDRVPYRSNTERVPDTRHEGSLKPLHNIDDLQSIQAPVPGSSLNKEHFNPMPERNWKQKLFSENDLPDGSPPNQNKVATAHPLFDQALSGLERLPTASFNTTQECKNAAGSLACAAHGGGLNSIDHVLLSANQANLFAVQGAINDPAHLRVQVDKASAIAQPLELSMAQLTSVPAQDQGVQKESQQQQETRKTMMV